MKQQPEYHMSIAGKNLRIANDPESQRAMFMLIRQHISIDPVSARRLMARGIMLGGRDLMVCRADILRDSLEKAERAINAPRRVARARGPEGRR